MRKEYQGAEIEIIRIEATDVITTSTEDDGEFDPLNP